MLDAGVSFYMSTSSLAAGVGVLAEEYAPYCNAEGNDLREGDWTLPEKLLFPAGSCVGITVLQKVPGDKYALVNTFGNSKEAMRPAGPATPSASLTPERALSALKTADGWTGAPSLTA